MKKKPIEQHIKKAFLSLPHDGLSEDVLAACRPTTMTMPQRRRPIRLIPAMTAVAAVLALIVCGVVWWWPHSADVPMTVSLDVNPSIALDVDEHEQIVAVTALNEEAAAVLGNRVYAGQAVADTVQEIIAAMVQQGYLSDVANSVLISVDSDDADKAAQLQTKLSNEVEQALAADGLSGAVMSQTLHSDKELASLAKQYDISIGKATLISRLLELDPLKTFEELAAASIHDLNLLVERLEAEIRATGSPSKTAYIRRDEALRIVVEAVGALQDDVKVYDAELDYERGKMCYEVEFVWNGVEYEYDLDAVTGEILKGKEEEADGTDYDAGTFKNFADVAYADPLQVKADVLAHAGLTEQDIAEYDIEWDVRRNIFVYDIEFESGRTEYTYHVNAETGEILDSRTEADDDDDDEGPTVQTDWIAPEVVKETVRAHAGCREADMYGYECEADTENGAAVYEIEFEYNGVEYEYTVDALTGDIVSATTD